MPLALMPPRLGGWSRNECGRDDLPGQGYALGAPVGEDDNHAVLVGRHTS